MCDNLIFMANIGKNIKNLRLQRRLSQRALARLCGWDSNSRIANYEGGGKTVREPTLSDIKRLAKILNVSPAALAFDSFPASGEFPTPAVKGFPILTPEQIKDWPSNKDEIVKGRVNFLHNQLNFGLNCFVYELEDDSMFNFVMHEGFRKGRKVIVNPEKKYEVNSYVIARTKNEKITFRKIIDESYGLALSPLNTFGDYPKIPLTDEISILGVVVAYLDILT